MWYVGLLGHNSPWYWANSFSFVCVVSALDSWNYCCEQQGLTTQHPLLNVCLHWITGHGIHSNEPPCGWKFTRGVEARYFSIYLHFQLYKGDYTILWYVEPLGLALQSKNSNCSVPIPHRQLVNYISIM